MNNISLKIKKTLFVIGDILILYLALFLTLKIRLGGSFNFPVWQKHFIPFSIVYGLWLIVFYIFGLYDLKLTKNTSAFYFNLIKSLGMCVLLGVAFFYFAPVLKIHLAPKTVLVLNLLIFSVLFSCWRHLFNLFVKTPVLSHKVAFLGEDLYSQELIEIINSNPQLGYKIISKIPVSEFKKDDLKDIDILVCSADFQENPSLLKKLSEIPSLNLESFQNFYGEITGKVALSQVDETIFFEDSKKKKMYSFLKRLIDVFTGLVLGICFLIISPFVALAIKIDSKGPVLYSQKRVGKNGKIFTLYKFRSMKKEAEKGEARWAKEDDPRITRVGKFLRKTLLDELPQFINILKGEMSFVGPRPERPEFVEHLEKEISLYPLRHLLRPGMTGWAQINYHYGNSIEDAKKKLQYELYYFKNRSLFLDFKIILKTIDLALRGGTL